MTLVLGEVSFSALRSSVFKVITAKGEEGSACSSSFVFPPKSTRSVEVAAMLAYFSKELCPLEHHLVGLLSLALLPL